MAIFPIIIDPPTRKKISLLMTWINSKRKSIIGSNYKGYGKSINTSPIKS